MVTAVRDLTLDGNSVQSGPVFAAVMNVICKTGDAHTVLRIVWTDKVWLLSGELFSINHAGEVPSNGLDFQIICLPIHLVRVKLRICFSLVVRLWCLVPSVGISTLGCTGLC